MTTEKRTVRERLLLDRKAMPASEREAADRATWNALWDFLSATLAAGATVAAYRPFGAEPGATLKPELPERLTEDFTVLLPVTLPDNDLKWTKVGTEIPRAGSIERARAVIVPGLAVSHSGLRLGRGGGSYDRALARVRPGVPVVALLRDGEFGVEIPAEAHDRSVTAVVTPTDGLVTIE